MTQKEKCIAIWQRAMISPVTMRFTDKRQLEKARFALYSVFRKCNNQALLDIKEACEISIDRETGTLTIRRKDLDPFHDMFDRELNQALGGGNPADPATFAGGKVPKNEDFNPEESLKRLQDKLDRETDTSTRPDTPYFSREEE